MWCFAGVQICLSTVGFYRGFVICSFCFGLEVQIEVQICLSTVGFYRGFVLCSLCKVLQGFKYAFLLSGFRAFSWFAYSVVSGFILCLLFWGFIGLSCLVVCWGLFSVVFYRVHQGCWRSLHTE